MRVVGIGARVTGAGSVTGVPGTSAWDRILRFTLVTNARIVFLENLPGKSVTHASPVTQGEVVTAGVGLGGGAVIPLPMPAIP
ncbi:MAG: hypothetical protein L6Q84_27310 [Polyangiaceae bacterium]|nr:hypothetical protein [Polyangiaceae bacterium]